MFYHIGFARVRIRVKTHTLDVGELCARRAQQLAVEYQPRAAVSEGAELSIRESVKCKNSIQTSGEKKGDQLIQV